jgi:formylglycine-generating enzyme required for sulfatase activity
MKFVLIPPGEFQMGSSREQAARLLQQAKREKAPVWAVRHIPGEPPRHPVKITRPFYLAVCEVTRAQYEAVMHNNRNRPSGNLNQPVQGVTWHQTQQFCRKLSEQHREKTAGAAYRLPTEAEWEYACRAGTITSYSFGDDASALGRHAWWHGNSKGRVQPVGRLRPNAWGLFDVHGNVAEWCEDRYAEDYYAKSPTDDPPGPDSGTIRVFRGGSATSTFPICCRSAFRRHGPTDVGFGGLGFRVVKTVTP